MISHTDISRYSYKIISLGNVLCRRTLPRTHNYAGGTNIQHVPVILRWKNRLCIFVGAMNQIVLGEGLGFSLVLYLL